MGEKCGQREEWSELVVLSREQGRLTKNEGEGEAPCHVSASSFVPAVL